MKYLYLRPTSLQAQYFASVFAGTAREAVFLQILKAGGATDDEIMQALKMNPSTARPRRIELEKMGIIQDSGKTRPTSSGCRAIVWETTGKLYSAEEFVANAKKKAKKKARVARVMSAAKRYCRSPTKVNEQLLLLAAVEMD